MKKLYTIFLGLMLVSIMIIPAGLVSANSESPVEVSGEVAVTSETWTIMGYSDAAVIIQIKRSLTYDGSFDGEVVEVLNYYMSWYDGMKFCCEGTQIFTGTFMGSEEGTYTATVVHQGWEFSSPPTERYCQTIISSTGGLNNLNGEISSEIHSTADGIWEGTYSGEITIAQ